MSQSDFVCRAPAVSGGPWGSNRSSFIEPFKGSYENGFYSVSSANYIGNGYTPGHGGPVSHRGSISRPDSAFPSGGSFNSRPQSAAFTGAAMGSYNGTASSQPWDMPGRYSPTDSVDDIIASPNLSDYSIENGMKPASHSGKSKANGKNRPQRRPSNRDEFDGPHQFLQRPPPGVIAMQERELPHLPTNLHIQEQDNVLSQVNDRLSQCAFDFVAKYQFPIPLTQDMRPVERPQDREWTEWVYLLKRLATKRRIPARVLYNGQIKQFVTILENSLEMRHAAKHQSRPLKDDRNILQLISAGIQVAKILKDASAMDYLDQLYVSTEKQIRERTASRFRH
ncbi:hypothetical protein V2G26_013583 [Clonostachys chloroleuca]|uniref:Uncharacterized protein n=4 Tax=Clonostachys TaxID=110564 RepID=A0A0B7JKJ2_BIOOC|nr:unnamed protein product [Clonostachys rosea f. rosea IK726]CAI6092083.1 unnamed protein product [Clonostachys chloroleuca]